MKQLFLPALLALTLLTSQHARAANFSAGETVPLSVSTSSASVSWTVSQAGAFPYNYPDVMACNLGSSLMYFGCGNSPVTATLPGAGALYATPLLPNNCAIFQKGAANTCAAITGSGTTSATFTAGQGQ